MCQVRGRFLSTRANTLAAAVVHLAEGEAQRLHGAATAQAVAAVRAAAGVHRGRRIAAQSAGRRREMARGLERLVSVRLDDGADEVLQKAAVV
jgi:hypothetical protein